jgi:hypothetical protein
MSLYFPKRNTELPDNQAGGGAVQTNNTTANTNDGLSSAATAIIVIIVLLIVAMAAYILHTCLRARRLGLPSPTWRNFVPFVPTNKRHLGSSGFEPTRPATGGGGVFGKMKNVFTGAGSRSGKAGYSGTEIRNERSRAAVAATEGGEWDIDMGDEELGYRGTATAEGADEEAEAGRGRSRAPGPFVDAPYGGAGYGDAGVSVTNRRNSRESERTSVFREGI